MKLEMRRVLGRDRCQGEKDGDLVALEYAWSY